MEPELLLFLSDCRDDGSSSQSVLEAFFSSSRQGCFSVRGVKTVSLVTVADCCPAGFPIAGIFSLPQEGSVKAIRSQIQHRATTVAIRTGSI